MIRSANIMLVESNCLRLLTRTLVLMAGTSCLTILACSSTADEPSVPLGQTCTADADCISGVCLLHYGSNYQGGGYGIEARSAPSLGVESRENEGKCVEHCDDSSQCQPWSTAQGTTETRCLGGSFCVPACTTHGPTDEYARKTHLWYCENGTPTFGTACATCEGLNVCNETTLTCEPFTPSLPATPPTPAPACAAPCGGDIAGGWDVTATCSFPLTWSCSQGLVGLGPRLAQGHLDLRPGGSFSWDSLLQENALFRQEDSCFRLQDSPAPGCTPLAEALNEGANFFDAVCTAREDGCDCSAVSVHRAEMFNGSWTTTGTTLTLTVGDEMLSMEYCRQDNTLTLHQVPGETGVTYSAGVLQEL